MDEINVQAQKFGREQRERADLVLLCLRADGTIEEPELALLSRPSVVGVATRCDLAAPVPGLRATTR